MVVTIVPIIVMVIVSVVVALVRFEEYTLQWIPVYLATRKNQPIIAVERRHAGLTGSRCQGPGPQLSSVACGEAAINV